MRRWFLWLRFQQHLSIKADFVCVVLSHVEELGNVWLFALHFSVPEWFVTFTAAPEDVVFSTNPLADFQTVLQLCTSVCVDLCRWSRSSTSQETRIGKQVERVPQYLHASRLLVFNDLVDDLVQILIGFTQRVAFWSQVAVVETEVVNTQLVIEFKSIVNFCQSIVHWVSVLVIWTNRRAITKWVNQPLVKRVPVGNWEPQPILHLLAQNFFFWVVVLECQTWVQAFVWTFILNFINTLP